MWKKTQNHYYIKAHTFSGLLLFVMLIKFTSVYLLLKTLYPKSSFQEMKIIL
ncbi:hypothetical protein N783_11210 [Pontibacillus marinus BH030004 = DSM 16465]|uniref:Uncharacterized protein n=1 Tax=Pontibacillus marinus BH030004 = DSM 16465 TaxID=1385511 RepID=A0A0A5GJ69_9BACI|nr:hypothetical protein N783_11210 [Pontibacillus marinus BH030004 = DSM 16465]